MLVQASEQQTKVLLITVALAAFDPARDLCRHVGQKILGFSSTLFADSSELSELSFRKRDFLPES